jgi:hypothetical protein
MAQAQRPPASPRHLDSEPVTGWVGWVVFAGIVMFAVGFFNVIEGLVALFNQDYYRVTASGLLIHVDYRAWGWTLVGFGVLLAVAGYGVLVGQTWARVVGVVFAALNAIVNAAFIAAYPVWITLTIALDVIVIYALIVHGREARALRRP